MRTYYWNAYGNNFGDAMGPAIVSAVVGREVAKLDGRKLLTERRVERNLFALGSIFHRVRAGDVVWGTGVNPLKPFKQELTNVDVRAVRGPLTRDFLKKRFGLACPKVYGDPGLLLPRLFPEFEPQPRKRYGIVPHFQDINLFKSSDENIIYPNQNWKIVVQKILECELVISSSLHGIITAEAVGIPARWLHDPELPSSKTEGVFKYNDYFASTNRELNDYAKTIEEALTRGGKKPLTGFDERKLLYNFPFEYYQSGFYLRSRLIAQLEDMHTATIQVRHRFKQNLLGA